MIRSRLPKLEVPGLSFHEYFFKSTRKFADDLAMINNDTKEQFTFADLTKKAKFIGKALVAMGVERGEVVMLCMENSPQAVYLFLAVSLAGAVACTLSPKLNADEMQFQIVEADCRIAFADPMAIPEIQKVFRSLNKPHRIMCTGTRELADGYPIIEDLQFVGDSWAGKEVVLPRIQPRHDIVYLPFSSGIHGKRKGILTTHYVMNAKTMISFNSNSYIHPEHGEYTVAMLPFHRQLGLETIFISLLAGATVVTVSNFCVHTLMTCIDRFKVKTLYLSPMIMSMMINEAENHEYSIEDLRTVINGSAAVSKDLFDDFRETFPFVRNIISTYGMTETGLITRTVPSENYSTTCGKLAANLSLKVLDLISGRIVGPYQKGVIYVKGVSVMSPYLNNEDATREQIRGGWRKTGDIGYYDDEENVYLVDKSKEMIKVHGYQVIPTELEALLITHPGVAEAAVVAISDHEAGERPVAFVVLDRAKPASTKQIMDYVNERVVRYKRLVQVNVAQTLPRFPCGSLLRRLLAQAAVLNVCNMP
uniref:AMP-dependent synthetase and ligase domain containing protein n=1 Tax=Haemonchus contortus TaxID=6289 RepID=A0A7I5EC47_HAECO